MNRDGRKKTDPRYKRFPTGKSFPGIAYLFFSSSYHNAFEPIADWLRHDRKLSQTRSPLPPCTWATTKKKIRETQDVKQTCFFSHHTSSLWKCSASVVAKERKWTNEANKSIRFALKAVYLLSFVCFSCSTSSLFLLFLNFSLLCCSTERFRVNRLTIADNSVPPASGSQSTQRCARNRIFRVEGLKKSWNLIE